MINYDPVYIKLCGCMAYYSPDDDEFCEIYAIRGTLYNRIFILSDLT